MVFYVSSCFLPFSITLDSRINLEPDSKREKTSFLHFIDLSKRCSALDTTLNDLKTNACQRQNDGGAIAENLRLLGCF